MIDYAECCAKLYFSFEPRRDSVGMDISGLTYHRLKPHCRYFNYQRQ